MEGSGVPAAAGGDGGAEQGSGSPESSGLDTSLYPGYDQVPVDMRQHLDPILQEINTNANKRVTEVNQQLEAWKPYDELGIRDSLPPEEMQNVMGLLQVIQAAEEGDPSHFKEWWNSVGNEFELFENEEPGGGDEFEEESDYLSQEDFESMMEKQMAPILQRQQQLEEDRLLTEANKGIDAQMEKLKDQYGDFDENVEAHICKLAVSYDGEDAIEKGFQDYKSIVEGTEGKLFTKATEAPSRPEGPGTPNTTPEAITNFKDATAAAKLRLEESVKP